MQRVCRRYRRPCLLSPLMKNAVVLRCTGRLKLQRTVKAFFKKPVEGPFIILSADLLVGQILAPSGGHQKKDMVARGAEAFGKAEDAVDFPRYCDP